MLLLSKVFKSKMKSLFKLKALRIAPKLRIKVENWENRLWFTLCRNLIQNKYTQINRDKTANVEVTLVRISRRKGNFRP